MNLPKIENAEVKSVGDAISAKLRSLGAEKYKSYYKLSVDRQPIFRSYENWLSPLKSSEEVLLSFEPLRAIS